MARPWIGITSTGGDGRTSRIERVGRGYLDGVAEVGGMPVVVPTADPSLAADAVAGIAGLLLTGGGDVEPARYGADVAPETGWVNEARDAWELALIAAARATGTPILAICRGVQVLNVAYGGTLVQHLPTVTSLGHDDLAGAHDEHQAIAVTPGSRLHEVVGADRIGANSLHHQAIDRPGAGLVVVARADDGVIEGVEDPGAPVLGVQWHPELLTDRPAHLALFAWLLSEARRPR